MQEISWGSLMSLVGEGVQGEDKAWAKERAGIKERWKEINTALAELRDTQCSWTIPDASLRANMKDAVAEDFVTLYKVRFCGQDATDRANLGGMAMVGCERPDMA